VPRRPLALEKALRATGGERPPARPAPVLAAGKACASRCLVCEPAPVDEQVTQFVGVALDFSSALPYIVPALMERAAPKVVFDMEQHEFVADPEGTDCVVCGRWQRVPGEVAGCGGGGVGGHWATARGGGAGWWPRMLWRAS
jgi:hypothetical protein